MQTNPAAYKYHANKWLAHKNAVAARTTTGTRKARHLALYRGYMRCAAAHLATLA